MSCERTKILLNKIKTKLVIGTVQGFSVLNSSKIIFDMHTTPQNDGEASVHKKKKKKP